MKAAAEMLAYAVGVARATNLTSYLLPSKQVNYSLSL